MRVALLVAAVGLICVVPVPGSAQAVLRPEQMRGLAIAMMQAGDVAQAVALATALLQRDPDDLAALLVLAQAAYQIGEFATARQYAAQAHRVAVPEATRYSAARLAALAAAQEG